MLLFLALKLKNPKLAAKYTARNNLVGVITNGTAVLGLGNIGALASKPVMEGKGVLFKKFAGIDVLILRLIKMTQISLSKRSQALNQPLGVLT